MLKFIIFFTFLSLAFQAGDNIDYLKNAQNSVDKVYKTIVDVGCKHAGKYPKKFEEIKVFKTMNCATSASITYQEAGLLKKGQKVSHTSSVKDILSHYDVPDLKKSLSLTMTGYSNLKKGSCDFVKVMKKYPDMPEWLKKKGIMYVQDSNICISAGNKKIYSCNSTGETYSKTKVNPLRTHGYAFKSPILWAVVPRSFGKSNVESSTKLKHFPC